jgi:chromosomal replication initiation ATPase DnaA
MTGVPDQLTLDLPHRPALGAEDFLISGSNQAAADIVDRWPDWPHRSVVVVAPPGAGKTHLANVWRLKSGAAAFAASALSEPDVARATGALLIEDLHAGIGDQRALFHLLNLVREHKLSMLPTSRLARGELDVSVPDLRSPLRALPVVTEVSNGRRHSSASIGDVSTLVAAAEHMALVATTRVRGSYAQTPQNAAFASTNRP